MCLSQNLGNQIQYLIIGSESSTGSYSCGGFNSSTGAEYRGGADSSKDPDPCNSNSNTFGCNSGSGAGSSKNRIHNTSSCWHRQREGIHNASRGRAAVKKAKTKPLRQQYSLGHPLSRDVLFCLRSYGYQLG